MTPWSWWWLEEDGDNFGGWTGDCSSQDEVIAEAARELPIGRRALDACQYGRGRVMERLPNGAGKTPGKTANPVDLTGGRNPLRGKAFGCIAQLVEQLTLNQPRYLGNQRSPDKTASKSTTTDQWVTLIFQNARRVPAPYVRRGGLVGGRNERS